MRPTIVDERHEQLGSYEPSPRFSFGGTSGAADDAQRHVDGCADDKAMLIMTAHAARSGAL